ncbi:unnamed protein product [Rotaria sp. Silwood1]|nr:unnamed protein product [Rotaria sp. Silwood1]
MDDYSTKIKISAEHLIRVVFPEKALELDTLVSSPVLSFSEVSKVRAEIRLPTADDLLAHSNNIASGDDRHHSASVPNTNTTKKRRTDSTDNANSTPSSSTSRNVDAGTPVYIFNGIVPSNPLITILEEKPKPFIFHFLDSVCIIYT